MLILVRIKSEHRCLCCYATKQIEQENGPKIHGSRVIFITIGALAKQWIFLLHKKKQGQPIFQKTQAELCIFCIEVFTYAHFLNFYILEVFLDCGLLLCANQNGSKSSIWQLLPSRILFVFYMFSAGTCCPHGGQVTVASFALRFLNTREHEPLPQSEIYAECNLTRCLICRCCPHPFFVWNGKQCLVHLTV